MNRRAFFTRLVAIVSVFPFVSKLVSGESISDKAKRHAEVYNMSFVKMGSFNPEFYELYVDNLTGEYVDGHQIRPFLDWKPGSNKPRWAKIEYKKFYIGYRPTLRQVAQKITTYRNEDLTPVIGTEY